MILVLLAAAAEPGDMAVFCGEHDVDTGQQEPGRLALLITNPSLGNCIALHSVPGQARFRLRLATDLLSPCLDLLLALAYFSIPVQLLVAFRRLPINDPTFTTRRTLSLFVACFVLCACTHFFAIFKVGQFGVSIFHLDSPTLSGLTLSVVAIEMMGF